MYSELEENVLLAFTYAKGLLGTKYKYWHPEDKIVDIDDGPFWACNKPAPTIDTVKNSNCACTGVINLIRRKLNLKVPGVEENEYYAGGTHAWFNYMRNEDRIVEFDINKKYPVGTLLLRDYYDVFDQGHVAVIISEGQSNVLYEDILHSIPDEDYKEDDFSLIGPGIIMMQLGKSHFFHKDGTYTHACLPENWLVRE